MKKEKDEGLDNLFRKGLEDPGGEPAFREADWDAMEQMLDAPKKRSVIMFWLPVLGGVAAMLLVFLGYLYLKPEAVKPGKHEQMAVNPHSNPTSKNSKKDNTGTSGGTIRQAADSSKRNNLTANIANKPGKPQHGQKSTSFFTLSGEGRRKTTGQGAKNLAVQNSTQSLAQDATVKKSHTDNAPNQQVIANNKAVGKKDVQPADTHNDSTGINNTTNNNLAAIDNHKNLGTADGNKNAGTTDGHKDVGTADSHKDIGTADNKGEQKGQLASSTTPSTVVAPTAKVKGLSRSGRTVYAVTVLASSDLNGVNSSFQQSKVGGNFGLMFSATFAKKWTISTGAQYAIKPYLTNFDNYHTAYKFQNEPSSVNANCRMLDIPLNINYQVYSIHGNKITLGTGLSSYFMLREDYRFNYSDPSATGPATYSVINKNRNILSVINLDATYEHHINSKVGVTLQPYLKIPLSNVGYSQVRLQSSGVALGLNWNLNASSKPK